MSEEALLDYYADRAETYDDIYAIADLQSEYERLADRFRELFAGRDVFEVACGTGYWTSVIAEVADSIVGLDANEEPVTTALDRSYPAETPVHFALGDAYRPPVDPDRGFTAGFAGFWWSHVPKRRRGEFLEAFHGVLAPGTTVCMFDNLLVEGRVEPDLTDERGDSYQFREDAGDGEYRVLKNFPSESDLRSFVSDYGTDLAYLTTDHFWCLSYTV
jgi:demethylmenaquinone methyltransferase/2-methoxy-6-polyprenyl-1,4-benzoquinol methylase